MLSVALTKMIYNTECLFFLNTPNSIHTQDVVNKGKTLSPWIHTEIEMTKVIRTRSVEEYRHKQECFSEGRSNLKILHNADTSHMEDLTYTQLSEWASITYNDKYDALDTLYKMNNTKSKI